MGIVEGGSGLRQMTRLLKQTRNSERLGKSELFVVWSTTYDSLQRDKE